MPLKTYLQKHNLTVYQFADMCRLSVPVIYRALNNHNIAPHSAKRIKIVTQGVVEYPNIMKFHGSVLADD